MLLLNGFVCWVMPHVALMFSLPLRLDVYGTPPVIVIHGFTSQFRCQVCVVLIVTTSERAVEQCFHSSE